MKRTFVIIVSILALAFLQCSKMPSQFEPVTPEAEVNSNNSGVNELTANSCEKGTQASGAVYLICMPSSWNGDLVMFAHGYVAPDEPIDIPEDQLTLPDGTYLPDLINQLGFAFAMSSYSKNGLAVKEGLADMVDLVDIFTAKHGAPRYTYLVGGSEGGLITALAMEKYPDVFSGGLPTCGPIGDFRKQLNYFGDFRVVFDYFFPGVIPGSPVDIPQEVMDNWDAVYVPRIKNAINSDPDATRQLITVTKAAIDPNDPSSVEKTVLGVLWYNVFATNDANEELGGQPFNNMHRIYRGSDDDEALNNGVQRFRSDQSAIREINAHYQTSGSIINPVVTMHTLLDPIVPYWHERRYRSKVRRNGDPSEHVNIPIYRYGHCNFEAEEVLAAFAILVFKVTTHDLMITGNVLDNLNNKDKFYQMTHEFGGFHIE